MENTPLGAKQVLGLSIVLPCLNESETLANCIKKSIYSIEISGLTGEVIVADNGSTDGSQEIAERLGARVISVTKKGYGAALRSGIQEALGNYIVMGDSDDSYQLDEISHFINALNEGAELVIGNRFKGGIEKGAMPWLHRYLGNPVLSYLGRLLFKIQVGDFHCGLRAFRSKVIRDLELKSDGMEFASEMIIKASLAGVRIKEVPTKLFPDGRSRPPHLRTWRDGWRHLIFMLVLSPRWLFLYPGIFVFLLGSLVSIISFFEPLKFGIFMIGINSYFLGIGLAIVGAQVILLAILARVFSTTFQLLPYTKSISLFEKLFTLERGIVVGMSLILCSLLTLVKLIVDWFATGFKYLDPNISPKISGLILFSACIGFQILFSSFFAALLQTEHE